ncbi:NAD(P)/FAD-dependent oxidoreductase [Enhygromyxa salina]|uniref:Tryptophan halogenase n=1 Tax=Enhygromyxa salina TaxID=215803 RepID=A0A2S9YSJ3_9BACT|nr:FAD-dependent monooxygenase [Enhygromyxa salina]PRQ08071.1 Tryptophan halogenase [Enhygromyxa salina]
MADSFEVAILGGGLAAQCLARHLRRAGVTGPIVVIDRGALPIPATTLKLGESTVEAGAWYLGQRLGLHDRLLAEHEMKFGLRFFFSAGNNDDVGDRLELGPQHAARFRRGLRPPAYQLHRGRLEHMLTRLNEAAGVTMWPGTLVGEITLATTNERHRVELRDQASGRARTIHARWLIDASGRAGLLTRPQQLRRPLAHRVRVAHGWVAGRIDPERWTARPEFGDRIEPDLRWRSTVHLIGPGYSIWMIPVDPQITSIGVVARAGGGVLDPISDAATLNRWLAEREPQLAATIARSAWIDGPHFGDVEAHVSRVVVSPRRFAVCGEAAAHLDPLYSSGFDLLAIANELIVATVLDDAQARPLAPICEQRNVVFAQVARQLLSVYADAYRLLDAPRIATHKITWDIATYLGYLAPLIMSGTFAQAQPLADHIQIAARVVRLNRRMQQLFSSWRARAGRAGHEVPSVNLAHLPPVASCFARLGDMDPSDPPARWHQLLRDNLRLLEDQAIATFLDAAADLGLTLPDGRIDAHAISLEPRAWAADGLILREPTPHDTETAEQRVSATRRGMSGQGSLSSPLVLEPDTRSPSPADRSPA